MSFFNWSKLFLILASCSHLTECIPSPHLSFPTLSSLPHWSSPSTQVLLHAPKSIYGGQSSSHYSVMRKGPRYSSYQSVSRKFHQKSQHKPWAQKPWQNPHKPWIQKPQKPWTQKPFEPWTQKPQKPWHHNPWKPILIKPIEPLVHTTTPLTIPPTITTEITTAAPETTSPQTTTTYPINPNPTSPETTPSPSEQTSPTAPFPPSPSSPAPLIPDIDIDIDFLPAPLEDIDLPVGPPAILRPETRSYYFALPVYRVPVGGLGTNVNLIQ